MNCSKVTIIGGEPCTGKSTLIKQIIKNKDYSLQNGLGIKVTNDTKNKFPFVRNSGYKIQK